MRRLMLPLVVTVRAAYWVPMGLLLLPARDAARVVGDSLAVIGRHLLRRR